MGLLVRFPSGTTTVPDNARRRQQSRPAKVTGGARVWVDSDVIGTWHVSSDVTRQCPPPQTFLTLPGKATNDAVGDDLNECNLSPASSSSAANVHLINTKVSE